MYEISIVILLLIAIAMVALILVQQGKGAGMGASFGAGASNTVFGSTGSGNFLTRSTWFLIVAFFALCLFIGWQQKSMHQDTSNFTNIEETAAVQAGTDAQAPAVDDATSVAEDDTPSVD